MKPYSIVVFLVLVSLLGACKKDTTLPTPQNTDNSITSFSFTSLSPVVTTTINGTNISAVVGSNTNLANLTPTIVLPAGASIVPESGVAQNFTNPISYTVTAENGLQQMYTVTVKYDYQAAIDAKYNALGWPATPDNGDHAQPTMGGTGWVQYYGNKSQAIYYVNGSAYGMLGDEMKKYDALKQDQFAILTSDAKPSSAGSVAYYNEFKRVTDGSAGIVITSPNVGTFVVYGDIYKKYLALNRWDGVLGYPTSDESTNKSQFRYNSFTKNGSGGYIVAGPAGSQAIWGKTYKMWGNTSYETGWLGVPTSSCDPAKGDYGQLVQFQNGLITISNTGCGQYKRSNTIVPVNGNILSGVLTAIPCY